MTHNTTPVERTRMNIATKRTVIDNVVYPVSMSMSFPKWVCQVHHEHGFDCPICPSRPASTLSCPLDVYRLLPESALLCPLDVYRLLPESALLCSLDVYRLLPESALLCLFGVQCSLCICLARSVVMYIFLAYSAVHLFDVYCCVVHFLACSVVLCNFWACSVVLCILLACSVMLCICLACNVLACSVVLCISFGVQCCAVHFLTCSVVLCIFWRAGSVVSPRIHISLEPRPGTTGPPRAPHPVIQLTRYVCICVCVYACRCTCECVRVCRAYTVYVCV